MASAKSLILGLTESEIAKKSKSFNTYTWTLSYGQLLAIQAALQVHHTDALADEILSELDWFLSGNLPRPGEDKSEAELEEEREKERTEAEKMAEQGAELPDAPDEAFGEPESSKGEPSGESPEAPKSEPKSSADEHGVPEPGE